MIKLVCLAMMVLPLTGCTAMNLAKLQLDKPVKPDEQNPVVRIVCIWQPAEGPGLNDQPSRGFAGQIIFMTNDSPTPAEVEGDVRIYLFDDQGELDERTRPLHQFDFVDGAWSRYLQTTTWGPTYNVFVPYVREGSQQNKCALRVRLQTNTGRTILSDPAYITLPGTAGGGPIPRARIGGSVTHAHSGSRPMNPGIGRSNQGDLQSNKLRRFESFTVPQ